MLFDPSFEICALCFLVVMALYYFRRNNLFDLSSTLYALFLMVAMANLCFDIISAYTISYASSIPLWINMTVSPLYFASQLTLTVLFVAYTMALVGYLTYDNRLKIILLFTPALLAVIFLLLSPLHHYMIYFDAAMNYTKGPWYNMIYVFCFFYMFCGLFFIFRFRKRVMKIQFYTIIAYVLITTAAVVIQYFHSQYLLSGAAVTLAILMMYLTFQNPDTYSDNLTGLYTQQALTLSLEKHIGNRRDYGLIIIDINNLKFVNSAFGRRGGDELLVQIATFLSTNYGFHNCFRTKGDRFIVITTKAEDQLSDAIKQRFEESWHISGSETVISVSICKIPVSQYASNSKDVIAITESALLLLKTMGKGTYLNIDRQTADILYRRMSVETALQTAVQHKSFNIHFQPICSLATNKVVGAEALVRLYDTKLGNIPPDEFITVAEQLSIIKEIGDIVIENTCRFVAETRLWEREIDAVHINLSSLQCLEYKLGEYIMDTFERFGVPANLFSFELTESAAIASEGQLLNTMNELIPYGVRFAMDDYGSGYSNSSTIISFPFSAIKLDKAMLWDSNSNTKALVIYENTVKMIKQMNLTVIAEGIETAEQAKMLKKIGVDHIQGFYFSKPLPPDKFLAFLESKNSQMLA